MKNSLNVINSFCEYIVNNSFILKQAIKKQETLMFNYQSLNGAPPICIYIDLKSKNLQASVQLNKNIEKNISNYLVYLAKKRIVKEKEILLKNDRISLNQLKTLESQIKKPKKLTALTEYNLFEQYLDDSGFHEKMKINSIMNEL